MNLDLLFFFSEEKKMKSEKNFFFSDFNVNIEKIM